MWIKYYWVVVFEESRAFTSVNQLNSREAVPALPGMIQYESASTHTPARAIGRCKDSGREFRHPVTPIDRPSFLMSSRRRAR